MSKGLGARMSPPKLKTEKYLTREQMAVLLDCVRRAGGTHARRDHCALYLGYYLGLRRGEAAILERSNFADVMAGEVWIGTLKSIARIPVICSACGRKVRVSAAKQGQLHQCGCGATNTVRTKTGIATDMNPPLKSPPHVEMPVRMYIRDYIAELHPSQRWLFESRTGQHISTRQLNRIFDTFAQRCGLSNKYSWHSLRHGRGLHIYERFNDPVAVRNFLRQKSLGAAEFYLHLSPAQQEKYGKILEDEAQDMGWH